MKQRNNFKFFGLEINEEVKKDISKGYTFLIIADGITESRAKDSIIKFAIEGLINGETLDYVCTDTHPFSVKERIDKCAKELSIDLSDLARDDIIIIDAFTPNYGYKEDILLYRSDSTDVEVNIIKADSIVGIHSAVIKAWYAHKKRLKKTTGKVLRRPHRMIYDNISALSDKYGEDHIIEFFTHLISSEKAYGMFTIIVEYFNIEGNITPTMNILKQLVDCCLVAKVEQEDQTKMYFECTKIRTASNEILIGTKIDI